MATALVMEAGSTWRQMDLDYRGETDVVPLQLQLQELQRAIEDDNNERLALLMQLEDICPELAAEMAAELAAELAPQHDSSSLQSQAAALESTIRETEDVKVAQELEEQGMMKELDFMGDKELAAQVEQQMRAEATMFQHDRQLARAINHMENQRNKVSRIDAMQDIYTGPTPKFVPDQPPGRNEILEAPPLAVSSLAGPPAEATHASPAPHARPAALDKGKGQQCSKCIVCLEDCTHGDPGVVFPSGGDAGSKGESSSAAAQRCAHSFHAQCLRVYVQHNIAAKAAPPYTCPEPACAFLLSEQNVAQLQLGDADLSRYNDLLAEKFIVNKVYCPFNDCSAPQDCSPELVQVVCLHCHRCFCAQCRTPWHVNLKCTEYQALPVNMRTVEDRQFLKLARSKQWRTCPGCGHAVEREVGGCNFMRCHCKVAFCYSCGKSYEHTRKTASNAHGQANCDCGLFDTLEAGDHVEVPPPPPPPVQPPEPPVNAGGRPGRVAGLVQQFERGERGERDGVRLINRNGNMVKRSRTECRWSRSLAECPRGDRCWFWHEEDEPVR